MKLIVQIMIENGALDGPAILRAIPDTMQKVVAVLHSDVGVGYEVRAIPVAAAGVSEVVDVTIRSWWERPKPVQFEPATDEAEAPEAEEAAP